jgi:hypothetical protein
LFNVLADVKTKENVKRGISKMKMAMSKYMRENSN